MVHHSETRVHSLWQSRRGGALLQAPNIGSLKQLSLPPYALMVTFGDDSPDHGALHCVHLEGGGRWQDQGRVRAKVHV